MTDDISKYFDHKLDGNLREKCIGVDKSKKF